MGGGWGGARVALFMQVLPKKKKKGRPLESECYNLVTGVGKKKDFIERMQTKRAPELSCLRKEFRGGQKKPAAVIAFFKQDIGKSP